MSNSHYTPPSSDTIKSLQNEDASIRLLLAQRRLYSKAKYYLTARLIGMAVIGIGAPIVSVLRPDLAVVAGAAAGLWIFLGRTWFAARERLLTEQAAAVQEHFDFRVFAMPEVAPRHVAPSPEDVALVTANVTDFHLEATEQHLLDWYPIKPENPGAVSVAISQRANAAYTDRLLRTTATVWMTCAVVWAIVLVVISTVMGLSLRDFLLGIFLPVLPAALDVAEFMRGVRVSARERADLAAVIQRRLKDNSNPLEPSELLVWQDRLFELRSTTPLVPDSIYWLSRKRNETAMHAATEGLRETNGQSSSGREGDN